MIEGAADKAAVEVKNVESSESSFTPSAAPPSSLSLPPQNVSNATNDQELSRYSTLSSGSPPSSTKSILHVLELENKMRVERDTSKTSNNGTSRETQDKPNTNGDGEATDASEPEEPLLEGTRGHYNKLIGVIHGTKKAEMEQADPPISATMKVEPSTLGREKDFVESASATQEHKPNELAGSLETDIDTGAPDDSQMTDPKDGPIRAEMEQADPPISAMQVEPVILWREWDAVESASATEGNEPNYLAGNLGTNIGINAPTDSQMADPSDESIHADESSSQPIKEDNRGKEEISSGGEQTSEAAEPQLEAKRDESSTLAMDRLKERAPQTNKATLLLDRELLFDDSSINIPAFDDGSVEARQKVQGWTNRKWNAADKVLSFTAPVLRVMPGQYLWSSEVFNKRILAIYNLGLGLGGVILILRLPSDKDEIRRLLPIQGSLELSEHELHAFLVVESVADPNTCKLQLSQLTNATSIPSKGQRGSPSKKSYHRRRSCFNLLTPTEVAKLSAAFLPADSFCDIEYTFDKSLNDTIRCEDAIVSALVNAHSTSNSHNGGIDQMTRKHQVVLGTLHSYVISGNDQTLKNSLENALRVQKSQSEEESDANEMNRILDCTIIDSRDESGKTALHYACSRRRNSTIQMLVSVGADCSVSQTVDELTPCHICAKSLDEKGLSIVLSVSYPTRPDPNALDCHGRTPMYLAVVEGMSEGGSNNAIVLDLCLSALEAWGGQLILDSPDCKELLHPVHCVSAQWKSEELVVVLSHCNYRYPLTSIDGSDPNGISLSAMFHYPIHAALISLRRRIASAFTEKAGNEFGALFFTQESPLVKTLRTLLEHGFEPNERFEGIIGQGEAIKTLSSYFGTNPLQILALAAAETKAIDLEKQESGDNNAESMRILKNIMKVIGESAELLVKNGARINVQPPPPTRLDRAAPTGCYSLKEAVEDQKTSSMQIGYREGLTLDGNDEVLALLGGAGRVNTCQNAFAFMGKTIETTRALAVGSSQLDSDAPGGSDSNSCAICWKEFGIISNRRHLCRVSRRYVCNDCSTKRFVQIGSEHRVSDGQFLLIRAEARKANSKVQTGREEQMRKQRQGGTQARKTLGLKSTMGPPSPTDTEAKETKLSTREKISNAISGIGQTKNAVLERGDKLESLAEKTDALNQASLDFASMAKELNRNQNSWW